MASNYPTPMPQPGAPIVDIQTGQLTITGYRFLLNIWSRTGAAGGSNATAVLQSANNLSDVASAASSRANLGLGTAATHNVNAFLQPSNNLSDVASAGTARGNLGLGSAATHDAADFCQTGTDISVTHVKIGGVQVLGPQITGWGTPSGGVRGSGAAYAGQTMGAAYSQTAAQQTDDAVKTLSQKFMALIADLETQGFLAT